MTISLPKPRAGNGPFFVRLADGIEGAIGEGTLTDGEKLPPQRDLAYDLGVTVGTVGRAYALLRERGLVSGEVGRGTYVRARETPARAAMPVLPAEFGGTRVHEAPDDKLRFDTTAAPDVGQGPVIGAMLAEVIRDHPLDVASYSRSTPPEWREAGRLWLARSGWAPDAGDVLPTLGAHTGALAVIAALTSPGDRVVFETLTYSRLARSVRLIGRRIAAVETDEHGLVPEDFERLCAQQHPKVAFLMPALQNPTLAVLPEARRREIARIAARFDVWLIEDDVYGKLTDDRTPLLAALAPERTFVVNGLSKAVAAGLRGGWIACPPHLAQRVMVAHKMLTGGLPFLLAEGAARLVLSGAAAEFERRTIDELSGRHEIVRTALAGHDFRSAPTAPFVWLRLPGSWLSGTFKAAALREGVLVDDEDEFKPERLDRAYHRVRISCSTGDRAAVAEGLARLRRLLDSGDAGYAGEV
jgi:DNA-binding transcriptional MocR family regulator